ncbi:MAG: hypothetical protein H7Y30_08870 [Pyrinomonadaceae bacterium]|nr:hypothetical protein [Pyrinomonadaceae bacterium]
MRIKKSLRWTGVLLLIASLSSVASGQEGWVAARRGAAGKDLNTVYFADSKRGWIAGDDGFVSYTNDGGRTWTQQALDTSDAVNDVYFRNKEDGYLLAGNRIFKTDDGGRAWRGANRLLAGNFDGALPELYSIRFTGKKKGWVVGSLSRRDNVIGSLLLYTNDEGASWLRKIVPTREELIHLDFINDKSGWIVGASGTILHTEDAGETWTIQRSGVDVTLYHVDFRNSREGWAVGERGTILRTIDGGESWARVKAPVRNTLLSVEFVDDERGWIVGRGGVILRSDDRGLTWLQQESKTKQNLYALFMEKKNGWAVGGDGIVLQYER